jgi:hypothetical protein
VNRLVGELVRRQHRRAEQPDRPRPGEPFGETSIPAQVSIIRRPLPFDQRKFVKTLPDIPRPPATKQSTFIAAYVQVVKPPVAHFRASALYGPLPDRSRTEREAPTREGALRARRLPGRADCRPEVHHRLVIDARTLRIQLLLCQLRKRPPAGRRVHGKIQIEHPRQHAERIAVHRRPRLPASNGSHRSSRVIPHPRQGAQLVVANGEAAAETGHHLPGCGAEVAGTAVIAEPLPQPQHLVLRG